MVRKGSGRQSCLGVWGGELSIFNPGNSMLWWTLLHCMFVPSHTASFKYKASWLLEGSRVVHNPGHTKHSASKVPKYNCYSCNHVMFTDRQDASSSRGDCGEVHLGPVWSPSYAPLIPLWRDGEPVSHLCLTHSACEYTCHAIMIQVGDAATFKGHELTYIHFLPS